MPLKVNIPRVVLNRPAGYTFTKERFPKLKLLDIELLFDCLGDAGGKPDGDTTSFLDGISQDVTDLTIRDLTRFDGSLRIFCDTLKTDAQDVKGFTLSDVSPTVSRTYGQLAIELRNMRRSNTASSDRNVPPIEVVPPGHPPTERINGIISIIAVF